MPRKQKPVLIHPIVEKLTARREQAGLTRGQLAKALGYSRDAIYGWETGTIHPSFMSLVDWCQFFGLVVDSTEA